LKFKNIIDNAILHDKEEENLQPIIENLKKKQIWLHDLAVEEIVNFFDSLSKLWNKEFKIGLGTNLKYAGDFLSKKNLQAELSISLRGNYNVLDKFVDLGFNNNLLYHAQPRGLSVHWLAGNVDILGIFSLVQALLTKNVCLVKAPKNYSLLRDLLLSFKKIETNRISGEEFLKCVSLVYVQKDDFKNQNKMSDSADVRIAWGGSEAISTIQSLKKQFFTEDIIFGPKYSYAIIDSQTVKNHIKNISQRLAFDISVFDQYACNSPHTIFIENNNKQDNSIVINFAQELARAMDDVNRLFLPKSETSANKAMEILSLRSEYEFKGKVFASKNTDWTVLYSDEDELAPPCFSRVVFVRPIRDIMQLTNDNNRKIQSIGMAVLDEKKRLMLADKITTRGGDRCPLLGNMSLFSSPWDGMFVIDRLVRWVSVYKNNIVPNYKS